MCLLCMAISGFGKTGGGRRGYGRVRELGPNEYKIAAHGPNGGRTPNHFDSQRKKIPIGGPRGPWGPLAPSGQSRPGGRPAGGRRPASGGRRPAAAGGRTAELWPRMESVPIWFTKPTRLIGNSNITWISYITWGSQNITNTVTDKVQNCAHPKPKPHLDPSWVVTSYKIYLSLINPLYWVRKFCSKKQRVLQGSCTE